MTTWKIVRFGDGGFGAYRRKADGGIEYARDFNGTAYSGLHENAIALADNLNGKPMLPRNLTPERFEEMVGHVNMTREMATALFSIVVNGVTWKEAAQAHQVTESGILRAMRRVAGANHP